MLETGDADATSFILKKRQKHFSRSSPDSTDIAWKEKKVEMTRREKPLFLFLP